MFQQKSVKQKVINRPLAPVQSIREILSLKEPIKCSVPSVLLFHLTSWFQKVSSQLTESQIAGSRQSKNCQWDNRYNCPDCRYRQILLGFNRCGWHFYTINTVCSEESSPAIKKIKLLSTNVTVDKAVWCTDSNAKKLNFFSGPLGKQACCAGCRQRPFPMQLHQGKIHPFSKIAVTFEPIQRFWCPSRFIISENISI